MPTHEDGTSWKVFAWSTGILTTLILVLLGVVTTMRIDVSDLQTKAAVTQNDVAWIKKNMETKAITFK